MVFRFCLRDHLAKAMLTRQILLYFVAQNFLLYAMAWSYDTCPVQQDIAPCTCSSNMLFGLTLRCQQLQSANTLNGIISRIQGKNFQMITFESSNLQNLPTDIFRGVKISALIFKFVELGNFGKLGAPALTGLEKYLKTLQIIESFRKFPLTDFSCAHLSQLNYLSIQSAVIRVLPNHWFESGPYQLSDVFLVDNSVEELGSHAFASLINLRRFWFTGNKIPTITRDVLPNPAPKLSEINLSDNQIGYLSYDMFNKMPELKKLSLQNNAFTTIAQNIFKIVWFQIAELNFDGNPIMCDSKLKWMVKIRSPMTFDGKCTNPRTKKRKHLKKLVSTDLQF